MKVECSQCGCDIANFFAGVPMGICQQCGYLFCKNCIPKKCPTCGFKIFETKRVKEYPPNFGPKHIIPPPPIQNQVQNIKHPKIPCSQCGRDIAEYFAGVDMGICDRCRKVFCKDCLHGLKKQCNSCGQKLIITGRIKEYPSSWISPNIPSQQQISLNQMKFCRQCGNQLPIQSTFCDRCGNKV